MQAISKPIILISIDHYLPGFRMGGPLRSIVNLVDHLHDDFDFRIITSDRDLGETEPYTGIVYDRWTRSGPAFVRYISPSSQTFTGLPQIIRETPHDLLYLNSFFSPRFTVIPLVARRLGLIPHRPVVIAPRGEFSPGALEIKRTKKRAYIAFGKVTKIISGLTWQASSNYEVEYIQSTLGTMANNIHISINLSTPIPQTAPSHTPRTKGSALRIVFLSRISPKKNLDYALDVLSQVKTPIMFSIYGPSEDTIYQAECERRASALPANIDVCWRGAVDPSEVSQVMADHDLFFLPTRGENYGHVIAEALGAGTPVLLSDTTPWRGLAELGVGGDLSLTDPSAFVAAIERAAAQSLQEAAAQRVHVFAYAKARHRSGSDIEANKQLFAAALKTRKHSMN